MHRFPFYVFVSLIDSIYRHNAEMEKEIAALRRRLGNGSDHEQTAEQEPHESHGGDDLSRCSEDVFARRDSAAVDRSRPVSVPIETHPSVATPLTMKRDGSIISQDEGHWRGVISLFPKLELPGFTTSMDWFLIRPALQLT